LMLTFFVINYTRVISHNTQFLNFFTIFDNTGDRFANFNSRYATGYQALLLYNVTDPQFLQLYNTEMQTILPLYASKLEDGVVWWDNLFEWINANPDIQPYYAAASWQFKSGDICDCITQFPMTADNLTECKKSLEHASYLGWSQFLSNIFPAFTKQYAEIQAFGYTQQEAAAIITGMDFKGLDNLLYYGSLDYYQLLSIMRQNLNDDLAMQLNEGIIFFGVGIILLLAALFLGWYTFLRAMKVKFLSVKKVYSLLTFDMLTGNSAVKRWLQNNSKKIA